MTNNLLHVDYKLEKNEYRVIVDDDKSNILIAVGVDVFKTKSPPTIIKRRTNKRKLRIGRVLQRKKKRNTVARAGIIPSTVLAHSIDTDTVSSLTVGSDATTSNLKRSLQRNKKLVLSLKGDKEKKEKTITSLQNEVKRLKYNLCQEKKVSNKLLEASKQEALEHISVANSQFAETCSIKKSVEEMKLRKLSEISKKLQTSKDNIKQQQVKSLQKVKNLKKVILDEKRNKEALVVSLKTLQKKQDNFEKQITDLRIQLSKEEGKTLGLKRYVEAEKNKFHDEWKRSKDILRNERTMNHLLMKKKKEELKKHKMEMVEVRQILFEMADEVKQFKKEKKHLMKEKCKLDFIASQRLGKLKEEKKLTKQLKTEVCKTQSHSTCKRMKFEKATVGRRGGGRKWPIWVVQLICEMLTGGAPPSAIPGLMQTMMETMTEEKVERLPSISYIRKCRIPIQILGETMVAIKLARREKWDQLFTDGTTRRQLSFQNVVVNLMSENNSLDPVVVSSCIFMEDKTSEKQAEAVVEKVRTSVAKILEKN